MFTLFEQSEDLIKACSEMRIALQSLFSDFAIEFEERRLNPGENLGELLATHFLVIDEGVVRAEVSDGRPLIFFEPGDLVGIRSPHTTVSRIVGHSPGKARRIQKTTFYQSLSERAQAVHAWGRYLELYADTFTLLLANLLPDNLPIVPDVRCYMPGDPIVIENTTPTEVFNMLHGEAEVFLKDKLIGLVQRGEIFGAMAPTAKSTRSASIIAKTPTVVSCLPQEHFFELVKTHPNTLQNLMNTMARIILSQNEELLKSQMRGTE